MDIIKREETISLYELYQNLLTDKQRLYFEMYYFDDLSLSEIATNNKVSRNAVFDQIKKTVSNLNDYEEALKLYNKHERIKKIIDNNSSINKMQEIKKILEE